MVYIVLKYYCVLITNSHVLSIALYEFRHHPSHTTAFCVTDSALCDGQCFFFVYESLSDHPSYTTTPMWFWGWSYKRGSTVQYIKTIQTSETEHCPALPGTLIGETIAHYKAYRSPDIIKRGEINLTLSPSVHSFNHSTPVCTCQNDAYLGHMLSSTHVPGRGDRG